MVINAITIWTFGSGNCYIKSEEKMAIELKLKIQV